jgi:hypothetical protein
MSKVKTVAKVVEDYAIDFARYLGPVLGLILLYFVFSWLGY